MTITITCICGKEQLIDELHLDAPVHCRFCGAVVHAPSEIVQADMTDISDPMETVISSLAGNKAPGDTAPDKSHSADDPTEWVPPVPRADGTRPPEEDSSFVLLSDQPTTELYEPTADRGDQPTIEIHLDEKEDGLSNRMGSAPTFRGVSDATRPGEIDLSRRITPASTPMEGLPEVSEDTQYGINRIIRPHAKGGMGLIQIAYDQFLKREVALKELRPEVCGDDTIVQRFIGEAEITAQLEHPGIVPIHTLGLDEKGNPFYTMKLIKGITLQEAIKEYHKNPGPNELVRLVRRLVSVCQTISFAHDKGVIHRDLKPANIMLSEHGETIIMDWGLAKAFQLSGKSDDFSASRVDPRSEAGTVDLTIVGAVVGTPAFMSPEQASPGTGPVGPNSDVYSLGAILYVLLTGKPAYTGRTTQDILDKVRRAPPHRPSTVNKEVPRELDAICMKAMARDLGDRYASAQELMRDLCHWLDKEPVSAVPPTLPQKLVFSVRKYHKTFLLAASVLFGLLVAGMVLVLFQSYTAGRIKEQSDRNVLYGSVDLTEQPSVARGLSHSSGPLELASGKLVFRTGGRPSVHVAMKANDQACITFQAPRSQGAWNLTRRDELSAAFLERTKADRPDTGLRSITVRLGHGSHYFQYEIPRSRWAGSIRSDWTHLAVKLNGSPESPRSAFNSPSLAQISWIEILLESEDAADVYIDELRFYPPLD